MVVFRIVAGLKAQIGVSGYARVHYSPQSGFSVPYRAYCCCTDVHSQVVATFFFATSSYSILNLLDNNIADC